MDCISYKNSIWNQCLRLFKESLSIGLRFAAEGKCEIYQKTEPTKVEVAVNSCYLHRGYYCPSPVFDFILANSRRGKILLRPTKRSNITHRYLYNAEDEIYLIEYFSDGLVAGCEYIVQDKNRKYGFVFGDTGVLGGISVETYYANKLQSYMWVRCHNADSAGKKWQTDYVHYETYDYDDLGLSGFDLHFVALIEEEYNDATNALELVDHERYRPVYECGKLIGFKRLHLNNRTDEGSLS